MAFSRTTTSPHSDRRVRIMASPEVFSPARDTVFSPLQPMMPESPHSHDGLQPTKSQRSKRSAIVESPTEVTTLDHQIAAGGGTTSTLENMPSRLKATKVKRPISQKQWIEELTKDNGFLRQELAYYKEVQQALLALHHETTTVSSILEEALESFSQRVAEAERPLLDYWNIRLDEKEDVKIL